MTDDPALVPPVNEEPAPPGPYPVAPPPPPPPPPPPGAHGPARFDAGFVGPLLPPPPPWSSGPASIGLPPLGGGPQPGSIATPAPVSEAVLSIPLGTRRLVSMALDLLTRPDNGLRSASFYIGLILLMATGPAVVLFGLVWLTFGEDAFVSNADLAWSGWLLLAAIPAVIGYLVASVEATALATAVIGGRAEDRPLRLRESIAVARRRFWRVAGAELLVGIVTSVATLVVSSIVDAAIGPVEAVDFGVSLVVGLVVGAPFVYTTAGIVIGEVGVFTAIGRSFALVRARKSLAVVVTLFGVLSQFVVLLGLSAGLDTVFRLAVGTGIADTFPTPLAVPVIAAFVFALGTLTFLVEAIAAAPAVYAFAALTHYTRGLEVGRRAPLPERHAWDPYLTPGLAIGAAVALLALLGGIASLPPV